MSGIADVRLAGNVDILNISVDGISTIAGRDLLSKECNISGTGNVEILLKVSETLDIVFTGIGTVKYIGEPKIKKDIGILVKIEKIN